MTQYDALLLVSFGGPESPDDVLPFLEVVTRGRDVPPERLEAVAQHYLARGGVSPINAVNRELRELVEKELARSGTPLPVYWGNRNWRPLLPDTLRQMQRDGMRTSLAFVTSAYASYSSCRQYQEDIAAARSAVGPDAPTVQRLRHYFDHPRFTESFTHATVAALGQLPPETSDSAHLVFTAHSIPIAMAASSGPTGGLYQVQVAAAARLVADAVAAATGASRDWSIAYQSRSGTPGSPWLGPDVSDELATLARRGVRAVVVVPIGFSADNMEVVHDLDSEAAATAAGLGLVSVRAATPGTTGGFVAMVAELVRERLDPRTPRRALSAIGPAHDVCPVTCCRLLRDVRAASNVSPR